MASTSTTTATRSIVATLSAGSGVEWTALAQNLAATQFAGRLDRNTSQSELVDRQISASATLKNSLLQLASSVGDRVRTGDLSSQPQIANGAVAAISRGTSSALAGGTYSLEVNALAGAQTLASPPLAARTSPVGAGTLTIRFGAIGAGGFTEDTGHAPLAVNLPKGATLTDAAGAINAAGAGVSAYISADAGSARLVIKGTQGAANAFIVEAAEDPAEPGLSALAWSPSANPARRLAAAADAAFRLDGLPLTSASNTITDLAPGVSVQLTGTNPGSPTAIRFNDPAASVTTFMQDLTAALNELAAELGKDTAPQSGDLARDPGARALRRELAQLAGTIIMPGANAGAPATLADLGLATNRDGTFRLDGARLNATLKASPSGAAALFTPGLRGVFATLDKLSRGAAALGDPGSLGGSITRYNALKSKLADEKLKLAEGQDKLRAQLITRFAGVDTRVGSAKSTLSFLQNQIAAWNAQRA